MQTSYFLPKDGNGFAGDSGTTDGAGLITAVKTLDTFQPEFRPTSIITLLSTTNAFLIERYFLREASMWSTFIPLVGRGTEHGMDCEKSKNLHVRNPYYIFGSGNPGRVNTSHVALHGISVHSNALQGLIGGFSVDLVIFRLTESPGDRFVLSLLPRGYGGALAKLGFPAYNDARNQVSGMFALEFVKSFALFSATAFRGYMTICMLLSRGNLMGTSASDVDHCTSKSMMNTLFHNEDVITTLITVTPNSNNPFEPLRTNIVNNMRGFSFWGLLKPKGR